MLGPRVNSLISDFSLLDDWEDRYRYVIELGRELEPLPAADHTAENKVQGCASQVWFKALTGRSPSGEPTLHFVGDSDALIVRGLIAILFRLFNGRTVREIATFDPTPVFAELGLSEHLTPQRSNGLISMVNRIKSHAKAALAETLRS